MEQPFIYKYKPENLKDFEIDTKVIDLLNAFINMDNLNIFRGFFLMQVNEKL